MRMSRTTEYDQSPQRRRDGHQVAVTNLQSHMHPVCAVSSVRSEGGYSPTARDSLWRVLGFAMAYVSGRMSSDGKVLHIKTL